MEIKTNAFEAVKTRILSDDVLRNDFDSCVNLYKDFIKQKGAANYSQEREAKISAQKTTPAQGGQGGAVAPDHSVEDRYYQRKEYSQLSNAAKEALRLKWLKRGHQSGDQTKPATKKQKREDAKPAGKGKAVKDWSKREIMAIAKKVQFLNLEGQESSDSEQSEEKVQAVPKKPNRLNPELQRKK